MAPRRKSSSSGSNYHSYMPMIQSEVLGAALIFLVQMPLCAALERKNFFLLALLFHFITVVAIDILTGACLSPSFCLGFLLKGSMTLPEAFIRGATDLLAGLTFTYLISTLHLMPLSSPSVSRDLTITEGFLVEAALTAAFFVVILFVSDIIPKFEIRRPIIATTIRLLITIGAPLTGCFMNPTIALPFAIVTTGSLSSTVLLVYGLGPVLGTLLAMALWSPLKSSLQLKELLPPGKHEVDKNVAVTTPSKKSKKSKAE